MSGETNIPPEDSRLKQAYLEESAQRTLWTGRIFAILVCFILPYMIFQDNYLLKISGILHWRLVGLAPSILFLVLSFTLFKRRPDLVIPLHILALTGLMFMGVGIAHGAFTHRPVGWQTGATGGLFVTIFSIYVFAGGARRFLYYIIPPPLLTLFLIFYLHDTLLEYEWALFIDPIIATIGTLVFSSFQEKTQHDEFRMRKLALMRKDQLEGSIVELKEVNSLLSDEIGERRLLEKKLEKQANQLSQINEELKHEISTRKNTAKKLKEYAHNLRQSNEDLKQFAHVASHDLKEPLRMISSFLRLIRKRLDKSSIDDQKLDEFIAFAMDGAERMERLMDGLLSYSRVGTRDKSFEVIDLNEVLETVRMNLKVAIEESKAELVVERLPTLTADRSQMIQLFQNLINNSIRYRKKDARVQIQIEVTEQEKEFWFHVSDNGIGIDPDHHDRIFAIFQRLHTTKEYDGTGLGLAICKKIVERHWGSISVESTPGKGTTFHIALPRWDSLVAPNGVQPPA